MNRLVRKFTSLTNLGRAKSVSGQMATLLILLMVIGLSFVLFTANIGNVSVQSTALANSADASALQLSSQLSTKARQLYEGLGNRTKKCVKTGFLSFVLAIVAAIFTVVVMYFCPPAGAAMWSKTAFIFAGAVAGAVGGATGGAIAGTGAVQGALTGAAVGAAVGMCGAALAPATTPTVGANVGGMAAGSQGAVISGAQAATVSGTAFVPAGTVIGQGATFVGGSVAVNAGLGTGLTGALSITSAGYNEAERQQALADYMDKIAKMFGKASEKDRLTQTTIMRALAGVVDDPNMSPDTNDCNYNNDTTELVSDYQVWWWRRAENIPKVDSNNIEYAMRNLESLQVFIGGLLGGGTGFVFVTPDLFVSKEYMWETDLRVPPAQLDVLLPGKDPEGLLARSFRALEASGVNLSFWEPGPTAAQYMAAFANISDDDCVGAACNVPAPPGYDRFDMVVASLHEVYLWIAALRQENPDNLAASWDDWIGFVYDVAEDPEEDPAYDPYADPPASLYGILTLVIYEMEKWMAEIDALYPTWPECQMNEYGEFVTAPCRTDFGTWWQDASFDTIPDYEYSQVKSWLGTWGPMLFDFLRSALKGIAGGYGYAGNEIPGGKNPATYEWNDARGRHRVRVRVGDFRAPSIKKKKHGNWLSGKTCFHLLHYSDEWEFNDRHRDENYVEVSRYDRPSGQGAIGRWNPLNRSITKKAYYSYGPTWDEVSLRKGR